jgi:hypothetical protein
MIIIACKYTGQLLKEKNFSFLGYGTSTVYNELEKTIVDDEYYFAIDSKIISITR